MNLEWISDKGTGLLWGTAGLGLLAIAYFEAQYRYFYLCVALLALIYAYKQIVRRDTPFQRRERELRRKRL
jgi:hypothetical protein